MKFNFYRVGIVGTALTILITVTTLIISPCLALPSNIQIESIDVQKIDPNVFKNPPLSKEGFSFAPAVYGKIEFLRGKYGTVPKCQNAEVYLISTEYTGGNSQKPIFAYKGKVSPDPKGKSDINTSYCRYSVPFGKEFAGKKAWVKFIPNGIDCVPNDYPDTEVIIPKKPIEKNYQRKICGIG